MTTQQTKQKLNNFIEKFELESGKFKSFEIIYDYVEFLNQESFTKERLADIIKNGDQQKELIFQGVRKDKKDGHEDNNGVNWWYLFKNNIFSLPALIKSLLDYKNRDAKASFDQLKTLALLSSYYCALSLIHQIIGETKKSYQNGDQVETERLISLTKEESAGSFFLFTPPNLEKPLKLAQRFYTPENIDKIAQDKKDNNDQLNNTLNTFLNSQLNDPINNELIIIENSDYLISALRAINKHIIDQIDSEEFLNKDKAKHE